MALTAAQDSLLVLPPVLVLVLLLPDLVVSTRLLVNQDLTLTEALNHRATSLLIALPTLLLSMSSTIPTVVLASLPVPLLGLELVPWLLDLVVIMSLQDNQDLTPAEVSHRRLFSLDTALPTLPPSTSRTAPITALV
jgi:hypothetical protein